MRKYFLLLTMVAAGALHAQTASWQWLKNATMGDSSFARSIATDPSGNIFVDGSYLSSSLSIGSTTLSNTGAENIFLAKYDNTGAPQWAIGSKGKYDNVAFPLTADASGNVIVCGYFLSDTFVIGTDTLLRSLPIEIENAFIAKVSPTGASLWASRPYSSGYTQMEGVATDQAGNIYAAGELIALSDTDYAVFGNDTIYNDTVDYHSVDIFLVKYDPNGNVRWAKSFGGSGFDRAYSIKVDASNNVLMTGITQSATISLGTYTLHANGGDVCFVAKFDGNGNVKWVTATEPGNASLTGSLTTDKWCNVFFAGSYSYDSVLLPPYTLYNDTPGNQMMFVAKTDSNGHVLWATSEGFGGNVLGYVDGTSMVADTLGDVLLSGSFGGYPSLFFGRDTLEDDTVNGDYNCFVMEYDAAGFPAWAATATGTGNYECNGITADRTGNVYLLGAYNDASINLGGYSLPVTRGGNTFIAKLSPPQVAAVPRHNTSPHNMNVYPVPAAGDIHVSLSGAEYSAVMVTDMAGREVWRTNCNITDANMKLTLPAAGWAPGSYVVSAVCNGSVQSKMVVVR